MDGFKQCLASYHQCDQWPGVMSLNLAMAELNEGLQNASKANVNLLMQHVNMTQHHNIWEFF